ncbi:membrane protein insertase YidC [Candidatus Hepatobacter penaei]|uniref:membrane protein insertase YidC n=1 Tax=Candidatus Hepatobacter penaei TaxID=1274402 RepID=UPI0004F243FF|nr:membrane protein insertase YidC [Candidatus Hepatobacter penaei]
MGDDLRRLLLLGALCIVILMGGDYILSFFRTTPQDPACETSPTPSSLMPGGSATKEASVLPVSKALEGGARVPIDSPSIQGSINLVGGVLDDVVLKNYRCTLKKDSPSIRLLAPQNTDQAYYAAWTLVGEGSDAVRVPPEDALWRVEGEGKLTPATPVTLSLAYGSLSLQKTFAIDDTGMFFVRYRVKNEGAQPVSVTLRGDIHRTEPVLENQMMAHEGPIGFFHEGLQEFSYDKLKTKGLIQESPTKGWLGITDKYWLVAFAPYQVVTPVFQQNAAARVPVSASFATPSMVVMPGQTQDLSSRLFVGAKVLKVLDGYETSQNIKHFDLAVDFGWFYFLTKPTFHVLSWLKTWTGNFGLALLLFTILLKIIFFPLANKSYRSMTRMKLLTPKLEELKKRYKSDPQRMSAEVMALYKREKVNPISGCLPMFLQFPFFFALYKVLSVSIEMRHAPFWGWIQDLSAPDPTNLFTLFGLLPITLPGFLHLGVWPLLMGLSMFLQQKLSPPPADPVQKNMFLYGMPIIFTFMFGQLAAGLVIFWTWNNLLSVGQQWMITRSAAQA